jgi:cell division protein FtsB
MINSNKKFILVSTFLIIFTFVLAYYIANLLFYGKNSYEVYSNLQNKKIKLQQDIKMLQYENAMLQKKYFELKNLEPEEL